MRTLFLVFLLLGFASFASANFARAQGTGDREFKECADCPVMIGIPAGSFVMGSPPSESGRFDIEGPQHKVSLKAFALGKYPVTSAEFLVFLKDTGYQPAPCDKIQKLAWHTLGKGFAYPPLTVEPPRWPAVCLSWKDAHAYIDWLNAKVRAERPALSQASPYRLPSEAEWEYAARGGTTAARWWGDALGVNNANCNGCGSPWDYRVLADVDAFAPNPFGLYATLGNAWQWTEDCWHESYVGAPADGVAWATPDCMRHVLRGGSWDNVPAFVRSAARAPGGGEAGDYDYSAVAGFRLARNLP
jgi:formylglycine-generating enzyme required for sulfatase activity